jgi:uncharacterized repeat protein (TIGR01451 family)
MSRNKETKSKTIKPMLLILAFLALALANQTSRAAPGDAVVPGVIRIDATFDNLSALWWISGDANHDSAMSLEFRKLGDSSWHAGAPALRAYPTIVVDGSPLNLNYWAASVAFLQPGQTYELRLTLIDPDGGNATNIVSAVTRSLLMPDPNGRQLYVIPGSGGGDGSLNHPFLGLQSAANAAQPGDVFHLAAGTYNPFQLLASGTDGHPIVFLGPGAKTAIIDGAGTTRGIVTLGEYDQTIGYIIVAGLTIQNGAWGVDAQNSHDIFISYNTITDVDNGIINRRENNQEFNQTISDNIIEGRTTWPGIGIPAEEGIDIRGSGNVVAYNSVRYFGDCISVDPQTWPSYGNDIFWNDVSYCVDDGIEIDNNQANVRVWRNRVMNSRMGVSVSPIRGGPAYIFRNEFFNLESEPIKMHNQTTGLLVAQNSGAMNGNGQSDDGSMWRNAIFRNNLFLGTAYAFEFTTSPDEGFRDFDNDAWGTTRAIGGTSSPYFKWNNTIYSRLPDLIAAGVEVHGISALFSHVINATLPPTWDTDVVPGSRDLRLTTGAPEIDSGASLPNFDDPFVTDGKPDLGAFEYGHPLPDYGPRPIVPEFSQSTKQADNPIPDPGQPFNYTIILKNSCLLVSSATLTDTLPTNVNYLGNLRSSSGNQDYSGGTVTWKGEVSSSLPVTITFSAEVDAQILNPVPITNTVIIDDGLGHLIQRNAIIIPNGYALYLPLVKK